MSRKDKKQAKKRRIAEAKGQDRMAKRINETARKWGNHITKIFEGNGKLTNRLGYCEKCGQFYCFNFVGTLSFCRDCRVSKACLKLHYPEDCNVPQDEVIRRECTYCRWSRLEEEEKCKN